MSPLPRRRRFSRQAHGDPPVTPGDVKKDYPDLPKAEMPQGRGSLKEFEGKEMLPEEQTEKTFDKEKKGR